MKSVYVIALYDYSDRVYTKLIGYYMDAEKAWNKSDELNKNLPWEIMEKTSFVVQEVTMYEQ